ncbi:MAG: sugar ABC transporter substrate-binding protein [Roseiflexaceae bacterium]
MSTPPRWFKLFAIFATLGLLLAACGGAPDAAQPAATSAAPAAAQPTAAPSSAQDATAVAPEPAAGAATTGDPVTLTIWAEGGTVATMETAPDKQGRYGKFIVEQFEKEHPGVTVKLEDHGWDEVLRQNLTNALLANTAPDVIVGEGFWQLFAAQDALVPLEIEDIKANLIPGTYQAGVYNGKVYALSAFTGVFGFERNCAVIKAAGLDCDKPPQTWDDLLQEATTITKKGAGNSFGYTLQGPVGFSVGGIFRVAVYLAQAGAPLCKDECSKPNFNDPKAIPVMEFLRNINKQTPPGLTFNPDEGAVYQQLWQGKSAYQIAGSWHTNGAKDAGCTECRYSSVPLPKGGTPASVVVGNAMYGVLKQSKNPNIASEWVKFMTRDDVQDLAFPVFGRLPSTRSALTKLRPNASPADQTFIDVLLNSKDLQVLPQWQKNPQLVWQAYNDMLNKLLTTDAPIKDLLDEAQTTAENALK